MYLTLSQKSNHMNRPNTFDSCERLKTDTTKRFLNSSLAIKNYSAYISSIAANQMPATINTAQGQYNNSGYRRKTFQSFQNTLKNTQPVFIDEKVNNRIAKIDLNENTFVSRLEIKLCQNPIKIRQTSHTRDIRFLPGERELNGILNERRFKIFSKFLLKFSVLI